jgi:hypothetical protein
MNFTYWQKNCEDIYRPDCFVLPHSLLLVPFAVVSFFSFLPLDES